MTMTKARVRTRTTSKQALIDAALQLFYAKGFDGTSIRDIAGKAGINPANIAYHFKNKNGLLEFCVTQYLEGYTKILEKEMKKLESGRPDDCLFSILSGLIRYQSSNHIAARFISREMTLESTLNREILTTYMAKEKHCFQLVIEKGIEIGMFKRIAVPMFILQLKGLLTAPVLHSPYAVELLNFYPQDLYYAEKYEKHCRALIGEMLLKDGYSHDLARIADGFNRPAFG